MVHSALIETEAWALEQEIKSQIESSFPQQSFISPQANSAVNKYSILKSLVVHTNAKEVPDTWMPIGKQTMPMNKQISMNPADKIKSIEKKLYPTVIEHDYK